MSEEVRLRKAVDTVLAYCGAERFESGEWVATVVKGILGAALKRERDE